VKTICFIALILLCSICNSFEFIDLRGTVDPNNDVQILFVEHYSSNSAPFGGGYVELKKLNRNTMVLNSILSDNWSYTHPCFSGSKFFDYTLKDNSDLSTINCGICYGGFLAHSAFIRIDSVNVSSWDSPSSIVNIGRSNFTSNLIYATYSNFGSYRLITSVDEGLNWSSIEDAPEYILKGVSPFDDQLLFLASASGDLYRSEDGALISILVDNSDQLDWSILNVIDHYDFLFDPDEQHIFAVVKDSIDGINNLVRSCDNGSNWEIIFNDLDRIYIDNDLENSGLIYKGVGTEIYMSTNFGADFTHFQSLPDVISGIYQVDGSEELYALTELTLYEVTASSLIPLIDYSPADEEIIPEFLDFKLNQNYPNPFNPETVISFSLTAKDTKNAKLEIFNIKGQKINDLPFSLSPDLSLYEITWDGTDSHNRKVSSGVYYYTLTVDEQDMVSRKMVLLK